MNSQPNQRPRRPGWGSGQKALPALVREESQANKHAMVLLSNSTSMDYVETSAEIGSTTPPALLHGEAMHTHMNRKDY